MAAAAPPGDKGTRRSSLAMFKDMLGGGGSRFGGGESEGSAGGSSGNRKKSLSVWNKFQTVSFQTDAQSDFAEFGSEEHGLWASIKADWLTWFIPGLVGVLTALSGHLIEWEVALLGDMRMGYCSTKIWHNKALCGEGWVPAEQWFSGEWMPYIWYCLFSTMLATISAAATFKFAPMARGSGIPEIKTILGGFTMPEVLETNTLVIKIFGLALSVAAGLSCGKEGPLVHIACCWSHLLAKAWPRFAKNESKRVESASCACAAGVAVAFGAPLGGVLFSLEEASTYFPTRTMIRAFFSGTCAAWVLLQLSENGKLTMFEATYTEPPSFVEWPIFILIGAIGGCLGALFVHYNIMIAVGRAPGSPWRNKVHIVLEVAAIAMCTAITSFPFLYTKVISNATIHALFQNCKFVTTEGPMAIDPSTLLGLCHEPGFQTLPGFDDTMWTPVMSYEICWLLAVSGLLRYVQMTFTFGCGAPSGLFIPSLYAGAALGRIIGIFVFKLNATYHWTGEIYPGVYSMLGAAAVLGGVCRVTISLVVIMFELTGGLQMIVPFMIVCITAKAVGDYFTPGIYDACITIRKYPFLHEPDGVTFHSKAYQCMDDTALDCLHPAMSQNCEVLLNFLDTFKHGGLPITRSETDNTLLGYVYTNRLKAFITKFLQDNPLAVNSKAVFAKFLDGPAPAGALDLSSQVDEGVLRVPPTCPAEQIHSYFRLLGVKLVFVVSKGALKGMITKKTFIAHMEELHHGHGEDSKAAPLLGNPVEL